MLEIWLRLNLSSWGPSPSLGSLMSRICWWNSWMTASLSLGRLWAVFVLLLKLIFCIASSIWWTTLESIWRYDQDESNLKLLLHELWTTILSVWYPFVAVHETHCEASPSQETWHADWNPLAYKKQKANTIIIESIIISSRRQLPLPSSAFAPFDILFLLGPAK